MSNSDSIEERQRLLDTALSELACIVDDDESRYNNRIEQIYSEFKDIYRPIGICGEQVNFRHQYSGLLDIIECASDSDRLDMMMENLDNVIEAHKCGDGSDLQTVLSLIKLRDHLHLDISRYTKSMDVGQRLSEVSLKIDDLASKAKILDDQVDMASRTADNAQLQMVAILGIFSAVILAFTGGFQFLFSSLEGLGGTPLWNVCVIVTFCGFVIFNILTGLLQAIGRILGRSTIDISFRKGPVAMVNWVILSVLGISIVLSVVL